MAWSTSRLAELAGTTLKAVRHYHEVGLLPEPDRAANGYKQYRVEHLVRLLRIRRLGDLGVPLSRIGDFLDAGPDPASRASSREVLLELDRELGQTVDRLSRVRAEIASILDDATAADLPAGFTVSGEPVRERDRALLHVYSRVYTPEAMEGMRDLLAAWEHTPLDDAFHDLPPDADAATCQRLAEEFAPRIAHLSDDHPWLDDPGAFRSGSGAAGTVAQALTELYNPAQVDVFVRVGRILAAGPAGD